MRAERAWHLRLLALLSALVFILAACGGDDDDDGTAEGDDTENPTGDDDGEVPEGGTLIIGAEQEPDCVAWIKSCAGASWGTWTIGVATMPRAWDLVDKGDDEWVSEFNADLLASEPVIDEETDPDKPTITYEINPDAQWSDATPITCDDFAFTVEQIRDGEDIYDKTGFTDIESVDCPDDKTVVLNLSQPYAGWQAYFGALYGVLPKHILEGQDILEAMADGYDWSGGPWIANWNKGVEITLTPNENWWGEKPKLDEVIFKIQADTAAEFASFQNREVAFIYPQPQPDVMDAMEAGLEGAEVDFSKRTASNEALWMNNESPPLDDVAVRQAIAYGIDRGEMINQLFGPLGITEPMQSLNPQVLADWSEPAWEIYQKDLDKVDELMTGAGWEKNGDGIWEKDGEPATLVLKSTAGNARRELTGQILQDQLGEAGFALTLDYQEAGDLFGDQLPNGDFNIAVYAQVLTALTPGQCNLFCTVNIPSAENDFSGQNWTRTSIAELDPILAELDKTLDEARQQELGKEADQIQADNVVSLPFDPLPNIAIWNDTVKGPVGDNPILGPFWNLHQMGVSG
jgi:peptide/nickel transport system substrate-binding protein